jgi:hypothetical protein
MTEDMQVRNLSSHTQSTYVQQVLLFARHFNKSPEILGPEEIRSRTEFFIVGVGKIEQLHGSRRYQIGTAPATILAPANSEGSLPIFSSLVVRFTAPHPC